MQAMTLRRPRWSRPNKTQTPISPMKPLFIYPQSAYRHFPIRGVVVRRNRRRRRWPMIFLSFVLGVLAGWMIRGGGAWSP